MIDAAAVSRIDTAGMAEAYALWPGMARGALETDSAGIEIGDASHVVFAGMGGSGTIGDIFYSMLSRTGIHVDVVKGYHLPRSAGAGSVLVATSISGDTAETLSVLSQAADSGCRAVAFSDGGAMAEFCARRGIEHRGISMVHSPRASLPVFLYSMLRALRGVVPADERDIAESVRTLERLAPALAPPSLGAGNAALALAEWLPEHPMIYYPWGLQAAAVRFKNSLQENAKMHAMAEDVIEACHNGIVAWVRGSAARPVLVRGAGDDARTKERWGILRDFFAANSIDYRIVDAPGSSILARTVGLIYLFDYASIYKAVMRGIDPTPVAPISFIKRRLGG